MRRGKVNDPTGGSMADHLRADLACDALLMAVRRTRFPTREAVRRAIFKYVEAFDNRRRRHSALGFLTPAEAYEQMARAA